MLDIGAAPRKTFPCTTEHASVGYAIVGALTTHYRVALGRDERIQERQHVLSILIGQLQESVAGAC
ncbi:hypothetical protein Poly21_37540 [Allorhodopirellula heiligendammensis]|uniref:Uncharacterized protein n=1 Tax=Allorhodopirellula heiligendammensis TaxID=2714739 RepID=A0A5C6C120_9BACT|nr:hypothetical protein Poly21_37540 [Allorhodopirellula heiligendammensis]